VVRLTSEGRSTPTVSDAMVTVPWTHGCDLSVAGALAAFGDAHVHMLLLTDDGMLRGTLVRGDLDAADPGRPALDASTLTDRTVGPEHPVDDALVLMRAEGTRRLAVVDADGRLQGLLCLKRTLDGFCSDADVAARAVERDGLHQIGR
jgi:CBS domain-containing protein